MRSILLALCTLVCLASTAAAQSSHERIELKPLTDGGETVGIKLKLTLRPQTHRDGSVVRIGIGRANWTAFRTQKNTTDHRKAAYDIGFGYAMYHQEIDGITDNQPREVELEIPYTALPGILPGDNIDIYTTWSQRATSTSWHVWGIDQNDNKNILKTPAGKVLPYSKKPKASMKVITGGTDQAAALAIAPVSSTVIAPLTPPAPAAAKAAKPKTTKAKLTTPKSATAAKAKSTTAKQAAAKPKARAKKAGK